jgi:hypothetical protein
MLWSSIVLLLFLPMIVAESQNETTVLDKMEPSTTSSQTPPKSPIAQSPTSGSSLRKFGKRLGKGLLKQVHAPLLNSKESQEHQDVNQEAEVKNVGEISKDGDPIKQSNGTAAMGTPPVNTNNTGNETGSSNPIPIGVKKFFIKKFIIIFV